MYKDKNMELKKYEEMVKALGGKIVIKKTPIGNVINILSKDNRNICANTTWSLQFIRKNIKLFQIQQKMSMDKDLRKNFII